MSGLKGVYTDIKKNGQKNYRASLTIQRKHISLGSYSTEKKAANAYEYAKKLLTNDNRIQDYKKSCPLSFEKYVSLINLRDNKIYISKPIYLENRYFIYFYSPTVSYKFDLDDLFYFSSHKLIKRGNHLCVAEYGLQTSVNERFGIRPFSVAGRDYLFINGDTYDYRRENLKIINRYFGVQKKEGKYLSEYITHININGRFLVGKYDTEAEAAIAYNKAADLLKSAGFKKQYTQNYIDSISAKEYAEIYTNVTISEKILILTNSQPDKDQN